MASVALGFTASRRLARVFGTAVPGARPRAETGEQKPASRQRTSEARVAPPAFPDNPGDLCALLGLSAGGVHALSSAPTSGILPLPLRRQPMRFVPASLAVLPLGLAVFLAPASASAIGEEDASGNLKGTI